MRGGFCSRSRGRGRALGWCESDVSWNVSGPTWKNRGSGGRKETKCLHRTGSKTCQRWSPGLQRGPDRTMQLPRSKRGCTTLSCILLRKCCSVWLAASRPTGCREKAEKNRYKLCAGRIGAVGGTVWPLCRHTSGCTEMALVLDIASAERFPDR